ncbi:MAG: Gfo/Idh/MocA family oxidoreductase [Chloroflexota bacterium]|nr:Gfo/Idh/MocA family oxidoreductase [Chloroflexota bacterium]
MRVMIVGAGSIANRHAAACRVLGADLVAICDVRRAAADALADRFGVSDRYTDLDAVLADGQTDVAIVATWGAGHAATVDRLARSGRVRAILCEKPIAMDAAQAEGMARVAADHGVLLAEAFRLRHQPIHHRAIEIIRSGRIGEVVHVRNAMMSRTPPEDRDPARNWRFNKGVGGGVIYDIGCYCINQLRWAMGAEPATVYARGRWGPTGVDEHVVAQATFADGRTAEWCVSWQAGPAHVAEVLGTQGSVRIENAWGDGPRTATVLEIVDAKRNREVEEFPPLDQFVLQLAHMRDCLEHGTPHRLPPTDSIAQMRVIDAVYASLHSGGPVDIGDRADAGTARADHD